MSMRLTPDICVIGAGSGGLSVAAAAAAFGVSVVLVEKGRMGGDCLNHGCVPSKALIAAGNRAHAMRQAGAFGIAAVEPEIDFRQVHRHVHDVIASIAPNDSVERFTALGVRVVQAEARFTDRRTVMAGDVEIRARRFVIATGSRPAVPPVPGIEEVDALTNETIFDLRRLPPRLVVIGGGPTGLELAQAYRRLGSEVTVIDAAAALAGDDPELVAIILDRLRAEGIAILERTVVERIERRGRTGVRLHLRQGGDRPLTIDGSHLLLAAGRIPNLEGLDLDKAGIAASPRGIAVSDTLRTANRRVYAIGDVVGGHGSTHAANYHAGLVIRAILFRLKARQAPAIVPRATWTDPGIAQVGLSEADSRARRGRIAVLRWPCAENDRARAERAAAGLVKLVADRKGRILGAGIVGANAGELIAPWALAVEKGYRLRDMVGYVPAYPTMGEIGKRAAISYFAGAARRPGVRRLIRFLRMFG